MSLTLLLGLAACDAQGNNPVVSSNPTTSVAPSNVTESPTEPTQSPYVSSAKSIDGGGSGPAPAPPLTTVKPEDKARPSSPPGAAKVAPPPEPAGKNPPAKSNARAGYVDPGCTRTQITFNDGFTTYWLAEGKGLVGFRIYANLDVYDLCDHGGISGVIAVYDANIKAKGGKLYILRNYVSYNRSGISGWQNDNPIVYQWYENAGWTYYYVETDGNIGMTRSTYFDYIKVSAYVVFDNVPGAPRRETCSRSGNGWNCKGHIGM